jgi:hypothetical protein
VRGRFVKSLLLLLVLVFAGCAQPAPPQTGTSEAPGPVEGVTRHTASGELLTLDASAPLATARLAHTGYIGTEPTVGVASTGAIFVRADGTSVGRSVDGGVTWQIVGDTVRDAKRSFDPYVHVDVRTDRVFNAHLYVACTWMTWSDDLGATWDVNLLAGCGLPGHDYQKITTGPPAEGVRTQGYDSVVYYVYAAGNDPRQLMQAPGTYVSTSLDGGRTFGLPVRSHPSSPCGTFGAPIAVGSDGVAYSTRPGCDGVGVARSKDSGATWEPAASIEYEPIDSLPYSDPNVAVAPDGRLLMTFVGGDGILRYVTSSDQATTFSAPVRLLPPHINAATLAVNAAGLDGRMAVAYLGTESPAWKTADPSVAPDATVWQLYLATTEDAFTTDAVWTTTRLTPADDPVQVGCIWLRGLSNPCRNLGDFIHMVAHEGRVYVTYTDGCDKCSTAAASRGRDIVVAIQETGPSLLGGNLSPLT